MCLEQGRGSSANVGLVYRPFPANYPCSISSGCLGTCRKRRRRNLRRTCTRRAGRSRVNNSWSLSESQWRENRMVDFPFPLDSSQDPLSPVLCHIDGIYGLLRHSMSVWASPEIEFEAENLTEIGIFVLPRKGKRRSEIQCFLDRSQNARKRNIRPLH